MGVPALPLIQWAPVTGARVRRGPRELYGGMKVTRFENPATPQRDAGGGIAVSQSGSVIILRRICSTGSIMCHSTVLRGSQKDVKDVKVKWSLGK